MCYMPRKLIAISGNIGSGKTSLADCIGQHFDWTVGYESVANNPYLPHFYTDMTAWAFHLQVYFLESRAGQHLQLSQASQAVVLDRSIYEDAYIFARALRHMGHLSEQDYTTYQNLFSLVVNHLPVPDLLIHLKAPVDTLMERIRIRARGMETGITAEYLELLETFYADWLASFDLCPLIVLDTSNTDYVNNPATLGPLLNDIEKQLGTGERA